MSVLMLRFPIKSIAFLLVCYSLMALLGGCSQIQLPRIDPSGNRLFLPGTVPVAPQYRPVPAYRQPAQPLPYPYSGPPQAQVGPNFLPPQPVLSRLGSPGPVPVAQQPVPAPEFKIPRKAGRIILTPDEIVAPVGSEVVVMAGLCGNDGHYVIQQPIEWLLSQESVGNMVTVGNNRNQLISGVIGPSSKKVAAGFAKSVTSSSARTITKGTPSPGDDVYVAKGQTWVTLTSPTEGTSHLTCVAPNADGWDRRRSTAKIHWLDARWKLPGNRTLNNGQTCELPVVLTRSNGEPIPNWQVTYEIVGGKNVGLLPSGSQKAELATNSLGQATTGIRQINNGPASAQVRIQVVRPGNPLGSQRMLTVIDQVVNLRWASPALSIEVVGPNQVGRDSEFTYRISVKNPGDAVARNAIVRLDSIDPKLEIVSMEPKGRTVGGRIEWKMGDLLPNQVAYSIDLKLKAFRAGDTVTCVSVQSVEDNLAPVRACMESKVSVPCIGLKMTGPTEAKVGQTVKYKLRIENQCEQSLSGVRLVANYDSGLNFPGHPSPIEQELTEQIEFGFYKELEISFEVKQSGRQCFTIDVTSNDGSKAQIQRCLQVSENPQPSVSISIAGPEIGEVKQVKRYVIDVKNTGNVALTGVEVAVAFDLAFIPDQASDGYRQRGDDELYWLFDRIEAGEVIPLAVDHVLAKPSDAAINLVRITSKEGVVQKDQVRTVIRPQANAPNAVGDEGGGFSNSLKINGLVVSNPIKPVDNAEINIQVLNDRPASDFEENVEIFITVPNDLEFVSGPRDANVRKRVEGNVTIYALDPIQALRGSQQRNLKFTFKPLKPDQVHEVVVAAKSKRTQQLIENKLSLTIGK
ncbi:MAG: hypothetical protein VX438_13100 [Planctomycetota bacterium]|nr:hypothetical protein [Planctomycetota bacterium]